MSGITTPSYQSGFASPQRGRLKYPGLWRGCVGAWAPCLGQSGLVLRDHSGGENHGTLSLGPTWGTSEGKRSIVFDGADDYVALSTSNRLKPDKGVSVSAWVMRTATANNYDGIVCGPTTGSDQGSYMLGAINTDVVKMHIDTTGVGGWATATTTTLLTLNKWHHVVGTWDGATVRIYQDGKLEASAAAAILVYGTSAIEARIGRFGTYGWWPGHMDDVRIYNRAIASQEISMLASRRGIAYERSTRRGKVPVGGFKAAWLNQRSQIIGGGVR